MIHCSSATVPAHILKTIESRVLRPNYIQIRASSNRPNTVYATHKTVNNIDDVRNYKCFLKSPFDLSQQPHTLIFVDSVSLTSSISVHLDSCLPEELQGRGIVKHYHSLMSEQYLSETHQSFVDSNGPCRLLVTTSGQSVVSRCCDLLQVFLTYMTQGGGLSKCEDCVYRWPSRDNR
jgi:superfamily II DNA helicase RecQ